MIKEKINKKLSRYTSIITVLSACLIAGAVELKALDARDAGSSSGSNTRMDSVECVRCHSDPKSIDLMRKKEDGAGYLFNKNGTFKDQKASDWIAHHKQEVGKKDVGGTEKAQSSW